jgi:glycine dehydrogenase subunit 1
MRYLAHTKKTRAAMLRRIGAKNVEELFGEIPTNLLNPKLTKLPEHKSELEVYRYFAKLADKNLAADRNPCFLGAGVYNHYIPATVDHIIQRSEFLTSYTPYQPEISQGTLMAIFEFQTIISRLTGMDLANASMYDGATAMAEAALMAARIQKKRRKILTHSNIHPEYLATLKTYIANNEELEVHNYTPGGIDADTACMIIQTPDFHGNIHKLQELRKECDQHGCLLVVVITEILALGLLPAPTEADIVCGEAQSLAMPMSFGGPHLGFIASRSAYLRQIPGRLCGQTTDTDGRTAYVLTLNAREQHIRRDKATSNICTNQGLCALSFTIYVNLLGEEGFKRLSLQNHYLACQMADKLAAIPGVSVETTSFFNEFVIQLPLDPIQVRKQLAELGIISGHPLADNRMLIAVTEMNTEDDMQAFCQALHNIIEER